MNRMGGLDEYISFRNHSSNQKYTVNIVSWNIVDDGQYFEYGGVIYPKSLGSDVMLHCFNTTDIDEVEGLIKKYREKQNNGDKNLLTSNFRLYV